MTDVFLVKEALTEHRLNAELQVLEDGEQASAFVTQVDADPNRLCPELFLLDLNLPRIPGLEVLARIRRSKRCALSPVVVMTSSNARRDRADSEALGATAYFQKPSGYDAFLKLGQIIRELLT